MKWKKLGLIYVPNGTREWEYTHAALPTALHISSDIYRIYYGTRDKNNCSSISYVEININNPFKILRYANKPVLTKGDLGAFDDSGVQPSCIVSLDKRIYLYYIGWELGITVPFRTFMGLAVSEDNGENFKRVSKAPIINRDDIDPFFSTNNCILNSSDNFWQMWYVSCERWLAENGQPKHFYNIKYAESNDGKKWQRDGIVSIDFKSRDEYAISRPCVIKEVNGYKMWYAYRGNTYRIGYAESKDGINWTRLDEEAGIDVSEYGWDSEMIEYPFVFIHESKKYMLYNGNGYGKTGFGLAVLE